MLAENNKDLTDTVIAQMLGLNQSYTSKLHRIYVGVAKAVFKAWREAPQKLTVDQMDEIGKLPKSEQQVKYEELAAGKKDAGARGRNAWVETAMKKGAEIGGILGTLQRDGHLSVTGDVFGTEIRTVVNFKKDATEAQIAKMGGAAEKAFNDAMTADAGPVATVGDGESKGKGKRNGAAVQAQA
jgi:hypothetical protein